MAEVISHTESEPKMTKRTLKALKGSIAKWETIVAGTGVDEGGENCPLCKMFVLNPARESCEGCPVMNRTGRDDCVGSPYISEWHRLNPWPTDEDGCEAWSRKVENEQHRAAARAELDFLKSLLPPDARTDDSEVAK